MIEKGFRRWHNNFDRKTPAMVYFNTQNAMMGAEETKAV
jgi:hypothetical protein